MEKYEKDRSVSRLFDETTAEARAKLPVAVMDSGVGGLCVLHEIRRILPCEELLYFGDSAFAPYGEREPQELKAHILNLLVTRCSTSPQFTIAEDLKMFSRRLTADSAAMVCFPLKTARRVRSTRSMT